METEDGHQLIITDIKNDDGTQSGVTALTNSTKTQCKYAESQQKYADMTKCKEMQQNAQIQSQINITKIHERKDTDMQQNTQKHNKILQKHK